MLFCQKIASEEFFLKKRMSLELVFRLTEIGFCIQSRIEDLQEKLKYFQVQLQEIMLEIGLSIPMKLSRSEGVLQDLFD